MDALKIEKVPPDLSFPLRLYVLMRDADEEFPEIISWLSSSHGTVFQVHDPDELEKTVLPKYFRSPIKFSSFRRQLLGYGFQCVGKMQYKHELFQKGNADASERISRVKSKPKTHSATRTPRAHHQTSRATATTSNVTASPHPATAAFAYSGHLEGMKRLLARNFGAAAFQPQVPPSYNTQQESVRKVLDDCNKDNVDLEPIPYSPLTDDDSPSSSATSSPESSLRGSDVHSDKSPLKDPWSFLVDSLQEDLEPRLIEEMMKNPNLWYWSAPTMTPSQQAWLEFTMAGSLPVIFYSFGVNSLAQTCCLVHVLCHSLICILTNFGGGAWHIDGFGPIQHIGWDMVLNQGLNSTLLMLGPACFGAGVYALTLFLIFANCATLPMNFKIHFEEFIAKPNCTNEARMKLLQHKLGGHIRRFYLSALSVVLLLATACHFGNPAILALSVFVYNLLPFWVDLSYWVTFSKELRQLPVKNRTILSDESFPAIRQGDKHKKA